MTGLLNGMKTRPRTAAGFVPSEINKVRAAMRPSMLIRTMKKKLFATVVVA